MAEPESFDIAVIGGGPAGSAAAICLSRIGVRTVLIERSSYATVRIGETLPPAIRGPLRTLGVWERFLEECPHESFAIRSAWGSTEPHENEHICNPYGPGWHVDRVGFDHMLAKAARKAGATLLTQSRVARLAMNDTAGWRLSILGPPRPRAFEARFLIEAAGRSAALPPVVPRFFRVIDRLIASVRLVASSTQPYTLIEAAESGWWYSAPLPGGRLIVAYMTDADLHAKMDPNTGWCRELDRTILTRERVGSQQSLSEPMIVSATSLLRQPVSGADWIAAGDAASAFDPLSGQGVYKALDGGIRAAQAVIDRFRGNVESFSEYVKWVNLEFSRYLQLRGAFYSMEQRWPSSLFWRRRVKFLPSHGISEVSNLPKQTAYFPQNR
jgi:2-polyprenyl-6-methoxyphenol hydroxylase-like FAD-dependent oxidoreductase